MARRPGGGRRVGLFATALLLSLAGWFALLLGHSFVACGLGGEAFGWALLMFVIGSLEAPWISVPVLVAMAVIARMLLRAGARFGAGRVALGVLLALAALVAVGAGGSVLFAIRDSCNILG